MKKNPTHGQERLGGYTVKRLLADIRCSKKSADVIRGVSSELDCPSLYCDHSGDVPDTIKLLDAEGKEALHTMLAELANSVDEIQSFIHKVSVDAEFECGVYTVDNAVDFLRDLTDTTRILDEDRADAVHGAWLQLCSAAADHPESYSKVADSLIHKIGIWLGTGDDYIGAH